MAHVDVSSLAAASNVTGQVLPYSLKVVGSQNRQLLLRSLQVSLSGDDSATAAAIRLVTFVVYAYAALPRQTVLKHMITAVKAMKVVTFEVRQLAISVCTEWGFHITSVEVKFMNTCVTSMAAPF